jgi:hypothetical protein
MKSSHKEMQQISIIKESKVKKFKKFKTANLQFQLDIQQNEVNLNKNIYDFDKMNYFV